MSCRHSFRVCWRSARRVGRRSRKWRHGHARVWAPCMVAPGFRPAAPPTGKSALRRTRMIVAHTHLVRPGKKPGHERITETMTPIQTTRFRAGSPQLERTTRAMTPMRHLAHLALVLSVAAGALLAPAAHANDVNFRLYWNGQHIDMKAREVSKEQDDL